MARFFAGTVGEAFPIPPDAVAVTVDSTATLVTGTPDWNGRPTLARRADDALLMAYHRSSAHTSNDGAGHLKFSDDDAANWTAANTALASDGGGALADWPLTPASGAFETLLIPTATPDEILLHAWDYNHGVSMNGTNQWRTTDGGLNWTDEGTLSWVNLTAAQNLKTYSTDQSVLVGSTIFVGGRVFVSSTSQASVSMIFSSSADGGSTWTRLATLVSSAALGGEGTQEFGFTRVGSRFLAIIRDTAEVTHTYAMWSTDLSGTSWGSLEDWTTELGGPWGRPRLYTRAQLKGEANWWNDPVLILTGFVHQTPGTATSRRQALAISRDAGDTWDGPFYLDTTSDDGGYSDIAWRSATSRWIVTYYRGTLLAADLKQVVVDIDGI